MNVDMNLGLQTCLSRELDGGAEIAQFEVVHEFVIAGKTAGRAAEFAGVVPVEQLSHRAPLLGVRDDGGADLQQSWRLWMPEAGRGETAA